MATIDNTWMNELSGSSAFNTGGVATILSFFGLNLADVNLYITFGVGIVSLLWIIMRVYLTYIQTKEAKRKIKEKNDK